MAEPLDRKSKVLGNFTVLVKPCSKDAKNAKGSLPVFFAPFALSAVRNVEQTMRRVNRLTLVLAGIMLLAACGSGGSPPTPVAVPTSAPAATAAPTAMPTLASGAEPHPKLTTDSLGIAADLTPNAPEIAAARA